MEKLVDYGSPKAKLTRMVSKGELIRIRRGLYIDNPGIPRKALANVIYGPSYISFQTALALYGMIPERVETIDSASFGKNRDKHYRTPLGEYRYLYLPETTYPHGLTLIEEEGYQYLVATKEKALCDTIYKAGPITNHEDIEMFLIENLRIENDLLQSLDLDLITFLCPLYGRRSLIRFSTWLKKEVTQ